MENEIVSVESKENLSTANGHCWCLLCGRQNPWSLKLAFQDNEDSVTARFKPNRLLQGYEGILHGGVVSSLLDASMTHCLFHKGIKAVTGDLRVRFLHPVPYTLSLELTARLLTARSPLYYLEADLKHDSRVYAKAKATFREI